MCLCIYCILWQNSSRINIEINDLNYKRKNHNIQQKATKCLKEQYLFKRTNLFGRIQVSSNAEVGNVPRSSVTMGFLYQVCAKYTRIGQNWIQINSLIRPFLLGYRVRYIRSSKLQLQLQQIKADGSFLKQLSQWCRFDLPIIDVEINTLTTEGCRLLKSQSDTI